MDRRAIAGGLVATIVVAGALFTSPSWVLARLAWLTANPWRLLAALLVVALVRPFLAWPVTLLSVVCGYAWGVWSIPIASALMAITSVPPYLIARQTGAGWATGRLQSAGRRAVNVAGDFRSIVASRLLPVPSDVVSVAAGVADVRPIPFVVGSAVGELPWAIAGVLAGSSVGLVLEEGVGAVFTPELVAAAAITGLMLLVGPAYEHVVDDDHDRLAGDDTDTIAGDDPDYLAGDDSDYLAGDDGD